ncbi:MAG: hypothetical protein NUV59_01490 [Patescibacteria group bacterium]|nr:hypothetical protein [Patescibacteria group bacterium]
MVTKISAVLAGLLAMGIATTALAQGVGVDARVRAQAASTTPRANAEANLEARIATAKDRATREIERRTDMLQALNERLQSMSRISGSVKASVADTVAGQISELQALNAKISADADIDTLRTDIRSITASYRIFALIIPQGRILVAADHVQTLARSMSDFAAKLETHISAAQTSGNDVTTLSRALADMNVKIEDAKVLASAAVALVTGLKPDGGDDAIRASNKTALREAHAKIQAALEDLRAARKDAGMIVRELKSIRARSAASSDASVDARTE